MSAVPARNSDPATSWHAAEHVIRTGVRAAQQRLTAAAVESYPGLTSLELSKRTGICRWTLARRLPELAKAGAVVRGQERACSASTRGIKAVTWHPPGKPEQRQLFGSAA